MASDPPFLFLFLLLLLGGGATASTAPLCNLTCSTDYERYVTCSCSAPPPLPVRVRVSCRGEYDNVTGSCSVAPPLRRCRMLMEDLCDVASVGTECTSVVSPPGAAAAAAAAEASSWQLADVVKPSAPFDVRVTDAGDVFNITWSVARGNRRLVYHVCVNESGGPPEGGGRCFHLDDQIIQLDRRQLPTAAGFLASVRAKMSASYFLQGPWSDWSPAAAWRPSGAADGVRPAWWFVSLPLLLVLGLLLLAHLHKPWWRRKLELVTVIPKPDHFFQPLYQNYQGNFKDWVKSAFSELDYKHVGSNPDESWGRKRLDVLWTDAAAPPQRPLWGEAGGGGGARRTSPSIHTVTLSGEADGERRDAAEALAPRGDEDRPELRLPPPADEADDVASLDSFASASRHSEDGYPRVDLDTIDSGFGECGSPLENPAENRAENRPEMFDKHQPTNYVRQWMLGGDVQDDGRQEALSDSGC